MCHGFVFHGIDLIEVFAVNFVWKFCYPSRELDICSAFSLVLSHGLFASPGSLVFKRLLVPNFDGHCIVLLLLWMASVTG